MVISTALPAPFISRRDAKARATGIMNFCFWILYQDFESSRGSAFFAPTRSAASSSSLLASYVLAKIFSRKMEGGMPIGFRFFMAPPKDAGVDVFITHKRDFADANLGTFLDDERNTDLGGAESAGLQFGDPCGQLPPMFR